MFLGLEVQGTFRDMMLLLLQTFEIGFQVRRVSTREANFANYVVTFTSTALIGLL